MNSVLGIVSPHEPHCLDDITRLTVRMALGDCDAIRVPYICQISEKPRELMMISPLAAERMVTATQGHITPQEARILALIHIAKLCVGDIADLLHMSVPAATNVLEDLVRRGLAFRYDIDGVRCYMQSDGEVHLQFTDLALGAMHA